MKPSQPSKCQSFKPPHLKNSSSSNKRTHVFYISKVNQILDTFLKDQHILLSKGHKIPPPKKIWGGNYSNSNNTFGHHTNTCICFRDTMQKAIEDKPKLVMKVDEDPFQASVNYGESYMNICIVGIAPV